jgi:hypothetical protein
MLDLTIVQGPLAPAENEEILGEVNRLTNSRIHLKQFCRWVQDSPEGPAFHALLHAGRRIVGHFSLIPLHANARGERIPVARTEYFFVHEDYRSEKVAGFQDSFLSPAILLLDELYRHCHAHGWGPFLASAADDILPFHELVGCRPVDFTLHECVFVLRPLEAARRTPNLNRTRRAALFSAGLAQSSAWNMLRSFSPGVDIRAIPLHETPAGARNGGITLFQDRASREWRYPESEYACFSDASCPSSAFLIAKQGSPERYLRVCDWRLCSSNQVPRFIAALLRHAESTGVLGVRWSVYENGEDSGPLLQSLRRAGFVCAPRTRRLLVYSDRDQFLNPSTWRLSDSLFCFDL